MTENLFSVDLLNFSTKRRVNHIANYSKELAHSLTLVRTN